MANNINELYDSLSDDPLFTTNFKSADDLETYLKTPENVKDFKKVYGAELDETQLMGLKKKEDTSSSSSVSAGAEPMVETPPMGVQDNNQLLGAEAQGIDLSGQPLPELGYGKGIPLPDPAKQKYIDGELIKIQKFLESNNPGAAFSQLRQLKMQNPDLKLTPEQNATLAAPLNKFLESRKAQPGSASLIKTITKDAADLGLTLQTVKPELTPEQKAVSTAVKQIPAEKLKSDAQPISEDVVGDMKGITDNVESDFINKFQTGLYEFGASIYRIPEFAYGLTKGLMTPAQRATVMMTMEPLMKTIEENNIPAQQLESKAKELRSNMQQVEGTISDRFAEGDYANGFTMISNSIAESLPATLSVIMTGGGSAGLGLMGLSTAVSKKRQLDEMQKTGEIDTDEQDKYINAVATGTAEALFEAVGIGSLARASKSIFAREGVEAGTEILQRGILDNFDNLIKKYPVLLGPLAEGMSEVATQIAQNAADKYTGVDPERDLFQGATDALIVGSAMGAGFGGALKIAQVVLPKPQRNKITENQQNIQRASELVQDPNITPEKKEALDNLAAQSSAENTKLEKEGLEKLNAIPEDKRMEFTQLSEKAANIEDQIDAEQDPLIKKALESELATTQTKIKEIEDAVQKQSTSQIPVQPEAIVGQEMVEGKPQAEPQVAPQEGKEEVVDVSNKEQITRLKERVSDAVKTKIIDQAEKGINTLKSVLPNFNIEVYENTAAYNTAMNELGGDVNSAGTFSYSQNEDGTFSGKILINLDTANERTINHEITHGILLGKFGETPQLFNKFHNQIKGVVSEADNTRLNDFINQYNEESKPEEYLAELAGIMSTEGTTLSPDIITKIAKIVNQIVSTITGGTFTPFAETANKADVIDFFNQISTTLQKGEAVGETALDGVTEQINPSAPPSEKGIDTSSLNQKYTLIQDLGLERFPEMKDRIQTGKTLSELGPVTAHLTFSDRLATGKVGERTYLGGILFGAATNNFWAAFSKGRVNGIINGAPKNEDGYRYLMPAVLTEEAHMSNMDMLNTSLELVEKNVADGTISPQDADARIKKALNKTDLKKFAEVYNTFVGTNVTAETVKQGIDEAIVKSKSTFEERKSFLESILGKANIDLTKRFGNLPSFNELANGLAEPITQGFEYGDILLTIRTKGDLTAVQPQPGDPDYHPSYPWVIRSSAPVETLVFKNAYNAVDVFPKVTNKQGQTLTYEDYKAKYGDGAKSRYLGYMGGRSTMSTSVTEPIVSEAKAKQEVELKQKQDLTQIKPIDFSNQLETRYGITVDLTGNQTKGDLNLSRIVIPEEIRNQGVGKKAMQDIIEYADANNRRVVLTPSKDFGATSIPRLVDFYKQFGFVENKGSNKDFTTREAMYRDPVQGTKVASKEIKTEEDFQKANEQFGTEDGQIGFKTKSQLNPKEVSTVSKQISNSVSEQQLDELKKLINNDVTVPTKTKTAYKLFKVKKGFPGELFPLFVGANQSVTTGEWIQAKAGELTQTKEGKTMVKSTLGPLAYRPGWHSGDLAVATHIGAKKNASDKAPTLRADDQVWAEVEVGDDVDWQKIANERAEISKSGEPIARTAHITDQLPLGGSYKYKTNSNMTGSWIISGEMKVNRVLTEQEVAEINKKGGGKDLPRTKPFDYQAYGFNNDGSVQNPKQVVSNQIARAYLDAKETGNNPELVSAVDSALQAPTKTKSQKYTLEKGPLRPSYGAPAPNVKVYQGDKLIDNPRTGDIYWYYGEANKFVNEKNSKITTKSQLTPNAIKTEYDADIAAGKTATEAMKNLLAQGYSYNQIGDQLGRANIQESYNAAIAEMGKQVAAKYSETQETRLKEIENYLGDNPVPVEQLRADLIGLGYADLEIFTAMNRNLFSQQELFDAFGKTYRQTVQNAIADSRYPVQDLNEVSEDTRSIKVMQSVSDLTDNFVDFSFVDANVLVEHMVNTLKKTGLVEAANKLAEALKKKSVRKTLSEEGIRAGVERAGEYIEGDNVMNIPQTLLNFSELTSIAGRILVMARAAKKDMADLIIGSIEKGPLKLDETSKKKIKELVDNYNLKSDIFNESRQTFKQEKDDASFIAMQNAEADLYQAGDKLMALLESFKLRYWNDVLTSVSTRALLSISTTPLSLWGNFEQGVLGQVSSPVRASISKVSRASKKTNRLSFADFKTTQSLAAKKSIAETWAILTKGKYTTPDMAQKYMDGIADVNAQKDYMDSIKFISDMIGSQMTNMTDEEFAGAYDKLMYQTQNGDIKLLDGKSYTVASAMFRAVIGTIPEITGRMLAISGDRIAFHGYKTRVLIDYIRTVEQEVKAGKRDTELQKYIAEQLGGVVKSSDMDLLINLSTVMSDNSDFGKEEAMKRVFMNDNFATKLMGGTRKSIKKGITNQYFKSLTATSPVSKTFATLGKFGFQGLDVAVWTLSPFTRVPVNVLAAGMQNTLIPVSPFFAISSAIRLNKINAEFNKKYGSNLAATLKSDFAQTQYEKARQELFEVRRQHNYNLSAVATSAAISYIVLEMALSGALTPPAGPEDEDMRAQLNRSGLRPSEVNFSYLIDWLAASPKERERLMITRGWKSGDWVEGYQNFGLIGQTMGYFASNVYQFGKEKVKKNSYVENMKPSISATTAFFTLGESSIQNISALQNIGLFMDIPKAKDPKKAAEKLLANMLAATGAVAAPNTLNFFAKGQAQTQMSLGQVIPSQEEDGMIDLGRVGILAATKLSKNSQIFGVKSDYYASGIGVFGEELKLNLTGMEPGTAGAYFSAMINPFGLRSFKQVKQGNEKADFANKINLTLTSMSMISDELGLMDEKGRPLNMWSALSINKDNKYEIGEGVNKVTLSLPFDLYIKELQILGDLRYRGMKAHIVNFQDNLQQMRSDPNNNANIEKLARATFNTLNKVMTNSLNTYESELTSLRLRGILTEMDKRGLISAEDKKRIEIALPGQFIK